MGSAACGRGFPPARLQRPSPARRAPGTPGGARFARPRCRQPARSAFGAGLGAGSAVRALTVVASGAQQLGTMGVSAATRAKGAPDGPQSSACEATLIGGALSGLRAPTAPPRAPRPRRRWRLPSPLRRVRAERARMNPGGAQAPPSELANDEARRCRASKESHRGGQPRRAGGGPLFTLTAYPLPSMKPPPASSSVTARTTPLARG